MKFIIILLIAFVFMLCFWAVILDAYTIVDTVYVPDSITVTMSWEEWQEYLYWSAPDSGSVTVDTLCGKSELKEIKGNFTPLRARNWDTRANESDSGRLLYIYLDTPIETLCTDTTNLDNLYEEL